MKNHLSNKPSSTSAEARDASRARSLPGRLSLLAGGALVLAAFNGCSSSGGGHSGNFTAAETRFASADSGTLQEERDNMAEGEEQVYPMNQQSFSISGDASRNLRDSQSNFRIRKLSEADGRFAYSIEASDGTQFTWEPEPMDTPGQIHGAEQLSDIGSRGTGGGHHLIAFLDSAFYDYTHFGHWLFRNEDPGGELRNGQAGVFWHGLETPAEDVPAAGTANYNGAMLGTGNHRQHGDYEIRGAVTLDVDFGNERISGSLHSLEAWPDNMPLDTKSFNDIALKEGTIDGNRFSGKTAAAEAGESSFSLANGAEGEFSGGFTGPNAEELGGEWSVITEDNSVGGGFGARSSGIEND